MNKDEFIREARYVVLKSADVMKCLTVSEIIELRRIQAKVEEHRAEIGKPPLDCVVVESDWPEYDPTWKAIEARVTGAQAQPAPSVPDRITPEQAPPEIVEYAPIAAEGYADGWNDCIRTMLAAAPKPEAKP